MEASLLDLVKQMPVVVRRPDGEILHWGEGCRDLYGYAPEEARGCNAHTLLRTVFPESRETIDGVLAARGEWTGRLRHTAKSGAEVWTETLLRLGEAADGTGAVVVEQNTDVTHRVELEERSALLNRELEHRVKNILAVVRALARMTFPDAPAEQQRKMDDRLIALAEANNLLQRGAWEQADLADVISEVTRRLGVENRIRLSGPSMPLASSDAMNLALAMHELATNAIKYGALSRPGGHVELWWQPEDDREVLALRWQEHGGPPVAVPTSEGFGMRLIRDVLTRGRSSSARIRYEPEGLIYEAKLALAAV